MENEMSWLQAVQDKFINYIMAINWVMIAWVGFKIIAILIFARIAVRMLTTAIRTYIIDKNETTQRFDSRRTKTIGRLISNVISYTIYFIAFLIVLGQLDIDIGPLIAGAGVLGLAIGFGAQNLVRDVITGFFIIFEDQFAVGDIIQTGNFHGTVEEIGLRITKIKSWTGEVHIIPNGAITEVTNFSINNSVAVNDISVAYEADIDKAIGIIEQTAKEVQAKNDNVVADPQVLGVQTLGVSDVVIRVTTECKPMTQYGVGRQMNAAVKKALDQAGIEIPYPRLVTFRRDDVPQQ
jgi:small-conductance mechanosensitive channel